MKGIEARLAPAATGSGSVVTAIVAVAAAYVYFLLFAEFALLRLVAPAEPFGDAVKVVLAALAAGGVGGSVAAARWFCRERWPGALAAGFGGAVLAAGGAWWRAGAGPGAGWLGIAFGAGLALGWTTVTLAAGLRGLVPVRVLGRTLGAGTGVAYALCNVPVIFAATPAVQALIAAGAALAGAVAALAMRMRSAGSGVQTTDVVTVGPVDRQRGDFSRVGRWLWIGWFTLLVGLDSGAFYAIQQTPELRAALWSGGDRLWANAAVHLGVALAAGAWLDRGGRGGVAGSALVALALAGAGLWAGMAAGSALVVAALYTGGVSLYSVALVEYPARSGNPVTAAATYVWAGWIGSGVGIGLVRGAGDAGPFAVVAGVAVGVPLLIWGLRTVRRHGALGVGLSVAIAAAGLGPGGGVELRADESELVARGREVYIAEGCMHCHSQFVRPGTVDVLRWGPERALREQLAGAPPLPGNRRQGPDLTNVGNRRSAAWERTHLREPRALVAGSRMPAYAHLFARPLSGADAREGAEASEGEALVAYLGSLGAETWPERLTQIAAWQPEAAVENTLNFESAWRSRAERQFAGLCASCHGPAGRGDGGLARAWSQPAPDLVRGPLPRVTAGRVGEAGQREEAGKAEARALARVIKFGLPGTDMPGHEVLTDRDVLGLAALVQARRREEAAEK